MRCNHGMSLCLRALGLLSLLVIVPHVAGGQFPAGPPQYSTAGRDIINMTFGSTPIGELPNGIKLLQGSADVVDKFGQRMLRASTIVELEVPLPQILPQDFTVELEFIPKECCNPHDIGIEGTSVGHSGSGSAQVTWHRNALTVIGGGENYQAPLPDVLSSSTPGAPTVLTLVVEGTTLKLYTNGRRNYTLSDRKFVRGGKLWVFLGGQDEDKYAVYVSRIRVIANAPAQAVASNSPPPGVPSPAAGGTPTTTSPTTTGPTPATTAPTTTAPITTPPATVTAVPATAPTVTAVPATMTGTATPMPASTTATGTAATAAGTTGSKSSVGGAPISTPPSAQPTMQPGVGGGAPAVDPNAISVGTGISDITGPIAEVGMMGYGNGKDIGLHMRLYARAFIFASQTNGRRVVFVSAELGQLFSSVKQGVLKKLAASYGAMYTNENVMISATHTHAGPGGYSHHVMYNLTTMGHVRQNYDAIVDGITEAITQAHNRLAPATVGWLEGLIAQPAPIINRSKVAFDLNPETKSNAPPEDQRMVVLSVRRNGQPAGAISWFAVHNTSLTQNNLLVSSDHKGYASYLFEQANGNVAPLRLTNEFVAAFPNGAEGDMSPNTAPGFKGPSPTGNEFESNQIVGDLEFRTAQGLFNANQYPVTGDVDYRHSFVFMPGLPVPNSSFANGMGLKTLCEAAYGVSFMAGAEDGPTDFRTSNIVPEGSALGNGPGQVSQAQLASLKAGVVATVGALLAPISVIAPPLAPMVAGIMGALTAAMAVSTDPCQDPKPVLLPTGRLKWTAETLPFQIFRIGPLAIAGIPGEMTVQAGRRLETALLAKLSPLGIQRVILTGLANEYSGYITTPEEYVSQQYEGASTLFGRLTFDAYQEIYAQLGDALVSGQPPRVNFPPPQDLGLLPQLELQTGVVLDVAPLGAPFGAPQIQPPATVTRGSPVLVEFQGAHPKNDLKRNDSYIRIERTDPATGATELVAWDAMPETKIMWRRESIASSRVTVIWTVPLNAKPGTYRIVHSGQFKDLTGLHPYQGATRTFVIP